MSNVRKQLKDFIPELEDMIYETWEKGIEKGAVLCKKNSHVELKQACDGDECSINLPSCDEGERTFTFHTHPRTDDEIFREELLNVLRFRGKTPPREICGLIPSTGDTVNKDSSDEVVLIGNQCGITAHLPIPMPEMTEGQFDLEQMRQELKKYCNSKEVRDRTQDEPMAWINEKAPSGASCGKLAVSIRNASYNNLYKGTVWVTGPDLRDLSDMTTEQANEKLRVLRLIEWRKKRMEETGI